MATKLKRFQAARRRQQNNLLRKRRQKPRLSSARRKQLLKKLWIALARRISCLWHIETTRYNIEASDKKKQPGLQGNAINREPGTERG